MEVSYDAENFLTRNAGSDKGVLVAEGEKTFTIFSEYYIDRKEALEKSEEFAYRDGGVRHNGWRGLMNLVRSFVYQHLEEFENRIIYYESSRGCPFSVVTACLL